MLTETNIVIACVEIFQSIRFSKLTISPKKVQKYKICKSSLRYVTVIRQERTIEYQYLQLLKPHSHNDLEALKVLNCRNSRNNTEGSCRIPQLIKLSVSTPQTCLSLQPSPARRHHPHHNHNHQHAFLLDFRADMHPNTRYLILSRQATLLSSKYCKQFKSLCVINPLTWIYCVVQLCSLMLIKINSSQVFTKRI